MQKKGYKGRCERRQFTKCEGVCRTYSRLQSAYAALLEDNDEITEFKCNLLLDGLDEGEYTTDFVIKTTNGTYRVRECVERKRLAKPATTKLLEASKQYWYRHGVDDWGLVTEKEGDGHEN